MHEMKDHGNIKNIVLIGLSGAGKSTVARYIAEATARTLIDMDEMIEAETGCSINEIFATRGEKYFRKLESAVIQKLSDLQSTVIACGGGVVLNPQNMEALKKDGIVFCLWANIPELVRRVSNSDGRPLLSDDLPERLKQQLNQRRNLYQCADHHVDTEDKSVHEVGDVIIGIMQDEH